MNKLILRLKLWYFKRELKNLDLLMDIFPDPNYFINRQLLKYEIQRLRDLING